MKRRAHTAALLALCFVGAWQGRAGQTEAEEFEAIFGELPPDMVQTLYVPFILDHRSMDELRVTITPAREDLTIHAPPLLEILEERVRPDTIAQLGAAVDADETVRLSLLNASGLEALFDWERLELRMNIPPELRRDSTTHLSRRAPPPGMERAIPPSDLSAFLNVRTGIDHVQQSATGRNEGLQPLRADFDGAVNLNDWVVEGSASFTEGAPIPWRRGNARLIRDDPERRIRYTFGDLSYPVTGFQNFQRMAGFTVARNFALQPYRVTEPRGQAAFFLTSPSSVEVLVNGRLVRTLQLAPGSHTLEDFLFARGGNDVALRITDDVGRTETLRLSFFFDPLLLARGEHEFSYSAGFPSHSGDWGPEYDTGKPTVSVFHRAGLTDTVTAGLNLQGNEDQQVVGAESVWATPVGSIQPDIAISRIEGGETGYAARIGHRYSRASSPWGRTWTMSAQYLDPSFTAIGNLSPGNPVSWNFSARYSQRLVWGVHGGMGSTYQIRREAPETLHGVNVFLRRRVGRSGSVDLSLDRRETRHGSVDHRAFISFSYTFPERRQRIRTSHDTFSRTTRTDWHYSARNRVGGLDGNVGVQRRPDDYSAYGGARYTGHRGEASLFHDLSTPSSPDMQVDSRTRFRFGAALVYADGQFALSRPVRDSFAILVAHPDLNNEEIRVDPARDSFSAKMDRWGPAVLPDLNAYRLRNVSVDAPDLEAGYDLGPGFYSILPTYKSGTVIEVGTGATILLGGILETADGEPAALQFGEVLSRADPDAAPIEFFTNRTGRFNVGGLRPGSYEMRVFSEPPMAVRFEVPSGRAGVYDTGTLQLTESPRGSAGNGATR